MSGRMQSEICQNEQKESSFEPCYKDFFCHLFDELKLLNLRLLRELRIRQKDSGTAAADAKHFFVSEEEAAHLIDSTARTDYGYSSSPDIEAIDSLIRETRAAIDNKVSQTENSGNFPFLRLGKIFGLSPLDSTIILLALAPEIDKKYERIYAYFNDDLSKKLPTPRLALDIFFREHQERLSGWALFSANSPVIRFDLIRFADGAGETSDCGFKIDERIKRFVCGDSGLPGSMFETVKLHYPKGDIQSRHIKKDVKTKITSILSNRQLTNNPVFWLYGKAEEDKRALVSAIGEEFGLPILIADIEDILSEPGYRAFSKTLFREAALQQAIIFFTGGSLLYSEDEKARSLRRALLAAIGEMGWISFLSAERMWIPENIDGRYQWYPFEFKLPDYPERKKIWGDTLGDKLSEPDVNALAGRFNFTGTQIKKAALYAKQFFDGKDITLDGIYRACAIQSDQKLSVYSSKIAPRYTWRDIVLPEDKTKQLREICSYLRYKHLVYFEWGFEKKLALGKGLNMLFSGPSGTGKTMAAEIIANDMKLEIYKIDISMVVSKYIGETEKNLSGIFREAETSNAILFFDEADALFGKRSEVKDAHDRYANIEINHLLQKIEEHEGVIILATNLSKNIDDAFLRRVHFTVDFPFPDERQRDLLWRKIFPQAVPLNQDVDYRFLSEKINLAGGNIKNIALAAAFYAAEESSDIGMAHIIRSAKREYQKMGKPFLKADFEPYYSLAEIK